MSVRAADSAEARRPCTAARRAYQDTRRGRPKAHANTTTPTRHDESTSSEASEVGTVPGPSPKRQITSSEASRVERLASLPLRRQSLTDTSLIGPPPLQDVKVLLSYALCIPIPTLAGGGDCRCRQVLTDTSLIGPPPSRDVKVLLSCALCIPIPTLAGGGTWRPGLAGGGGSGLYWIRATAVISTGGSGGPQVLTTKSACATWGRDRPRGDPRGD